MTDNGIIAPALPNADKNGWHKEDVWAGSSCGYGGDQEVGTAYDARYWKQADNGTFLVIDETYYVIMLNPEDNDDSKTFEIAGAYQFIVCTDRNDPGGTEEWSDLQWDWGIGFTRDDLSGAEWIAREWALSDQRLTFNWGGEMLR